MATARQLLNATIDITISPTGTVSSTQKELQVPQGDSIQFHNTATFPVNLVFTSLFGTVTVQPGTYSTTPLTASNVTVNYVVRNANTSQQTGGPYAVEFGTGPMAISISGVTPTPQTVAIPLGGQIQFTSTAADNIGWTINGQPANVWSPQPPAVSSGQNGPQTALPGVQATATYTLGSTGGITGTGTVHIGN